MRTVICLAAVVTVRYSHYWPPLLGTNCGQAQDGVCISRTASGERWEDWIGRGIACPPEWEFGRQIRAFGQLWTCVDRGPAVRYVDGVPFLDFLSPRPHRGYGELLGVELVGEDQWCKILTGLVHQPL